MSGFTWHAMEFGDELSRSSSTELGSAAEALTALASLVRSGQSLQRAVSEWPNVVPEVCKEAIRPLGRAAGLGGCVTQIAELVSTRAGIAAVIAPALAAACSADRRGSVFTSAVLEDHATALRRRAAAFVESDAGTSGARLSGRLVAGLPLAFLLLVPAATRPEMDLIGVSILATGVTFVGVGIKWLTRLTPRPPVNHPVESAVRELAALLRTGVPTSTAMSTVARRHPWSGLRRAETATRLGMGWVEALGADPDEHTERVAAILASDRMVGHGTVGELLRYAGELAASSQHRFEFRLRRAPILMVLPLTLCILPGFALLTIGPFLRRLLA